MSKKLLPVVPVGDGLKSKQDFNLESTVATLGKLDARDKITKIMQYGARFAYWWFGSTDPLVAKRAYKLYRTTQLSRKAFRMFKLLDEIAKLSKITSSWADKNTANSIAYRDALLAARCLAMACFWTFDNLNYLTVTETVNFGVQRAQKGFSRSWSAGSILLIFIGIDSMRKTGKKRQEIAFRYMAMRDDRTKEGNGGERQEACDLRETLLHANAEHFKSWLMVFKGILDLSCAINVTGMDIPKRLWGRKLNDGIIGAAGCASALCVLYNSWPTRSPSVAARARSSMLPQSKNVSVNRSKRETEVPVDPLQMTSNALGLST